jgi:hypothetical protein
MAALSSPRSMKQKWSMKRNKGASGAGTAILIIQKLRSKQDVPLLSISQADAVESGSLREDLIYPHH